MADTMALPTLPAVSRRAFLSLSLRSLGAWAVGTLLAPLRRAAAKTAPTPRFFRRVVTADNRTSALVEWQTDALLDAPRFLWKEAGKKEEKEAVVDVKYMALDGRNVFVYRAFLRGLAPGRSYQCRVLAAGRDAGAFSFRTDGGKTLKALIFPDSQCENSYGTWERVSHAASERNADAALWVNLGDLVDNGESFFHWEGWQAATDVSLGPRAFAPVMGNHECYALDWQYALPAAFLGLFATPPNNSAQYDRYYYSFDYGPVHFTVLNTQREELGGFLPGLFREQAAWLARDLARTKQPWRVALLHRDLINYDAAPPSPDEFVRTLLPILEKGGADAVLTAHAHAYRRRRMTAWRQDKTGVLYILSGNAGNCFYDVKRHAIDEIALPSDLLNYLTLEADENRLTFRCFLTNGIQKDFATLRKAPAPEE